MSHENIDALFDIGASVAGALGGALFAFAYGEGAPLVVVAGLAGAVASFTSWRAYDVDRW